MLEVKLIKIGFPLGILVLLLATSCWCRSEPKYSSRMSLWSDAFELLYRNTGLKFQTSGDFESSTATGLNWNMTLKIVLTPCSEGDEMLELSPSPDNEEKSFKLLDQIHSAVLLREQRERTNDYKHARGHLFGFKNSDILSTDFDFKNFGRTPSRTLNTWYGDGCCDKYVHSYRTEDGEVHVIENSYSAQYFQQLLDPSTLPEEIRGVVLTVHDIVSTITWMKKSDLSYLSSSEIDFINTQLKTGVFLSLKVVGSESGEKRIGYTLKNAEGSRDNCSYTFSSNLEIHSESCNECDVSASGTGNPTDSESFCVNDPSKSKDKPLMITRLPKVLKLESRWNHLIRRFRSFFCARCTPQVDHLCLTYYREVKGDDDNGTPLPNPILSFLICY